MARIEEFEYHLKMAFNSAVNMALEEYPDQEDTGVGRTLRSYTIPNLQHWIDGAQAGSLKHLRESINKQGQA
jgi:hypothetical protein